MAAGLTSTRRSRARRALSAIVATLLGMAAIGYYQRADSAAEVHAREAGPDSGETTGADGTNAGSGKGEGRPGAGRPGILLQLSLAADGSLVVTESVRLRAPVGQVLLRAPRVARAGGGFARLSPQATEVRLSVGDGPAEPLPDAGGERMRVPVPAGTLAYTLTYELAGSAVRSVPSTTGRALVAAGPLSAAGPAGRVDLAVNGDSVLNLTCPLLAGNDAACGTPTDGGYRLRQPLRGRSALVLIQVDLVEA